MPLGKYYCDYCDKEFQDTAAARRRHLQGVQHQRAKALWYDSLRSKFLLFLLLSKLISKCWWKIFLGEQIPNYLTIRTRSVKESAITLFERYCSYLRILVCNILRHGVRSCITFLGCPFYCNWWKKKQKW